MNIESNIADDWYSEAAATFGDRLAGAREEVGLTQEELAARLGIKLSTLQDWEEDISDPRSNKLQTLSGVLNVSISWLLTGEGEGLSMPSDHESPETDRILSEMREVRGQISDLTTRLGVLEGQLRAQIEQ